MSVLYKTANVIFHLPYYSQVLCLHSFIKKRNSLGIFYTGAIEKQLPAPSGETEKYISLSGCFNSLCKLPVSYMYLKFTGRPFPSWSVSTGGCWNSSIRVSGSKTWLRSVPRVIVGAILVISLDWWMDTNKFFALPFLPIYSRNSNCARQHPDAKTNKRKQELSWILSLCSAELGRYYQITDMLLYVSWL